MTPEPPMQRYCDCLHVHTKECWVNPEPPMPSERGMPTRAELHAANAALREENERLREVLEELKLYLSHTNLVTAKKIIDRAPAPFPMTEADQAASERLREATRRWDRPE